MFILSLTVCDIIIINFPMYSIRIFDLAIEGQVTIRMKIDASRSSR